jgi:glycyl-tRNA synthetase beta chain
MRALCLDDKISAETFNAVAAKQLSVPLDIQQRVLAVHHFTQLPEAASLAAANKRVSNILNKSAADVAVSSTVDTALLQEAAEKTLGRCVGRKTAASRPPVCAARLQRHAVRLGEFARASGCIF